MGKSREVTREQHAKGEASARGGKERESRKNHATCKKQDLQARLLDWLHVLYRSFSVFGANPNNIILADSSVPVSSVLSDTACLTFLSKLIQNIQHHTPPYITIHPFTSPYTPIQHHIPLYNTIYPYTTPYTPIHHHTPLYIAIYPNTTPYTHIQHHILLYITIHPYTSPYTSIYHHTSLYITIHPHT